MSEIINQSRFSPVNLEHYGQPQAFTVTLYDRCAGLAYSVNIAGDSHAYKKWKTAKSRYDAIVSAYEASPSWRRIGAPDRPQLKSVPPVPLPVPIVRAPDTTIGAQWMLF